jgi:hypothetical protein
MMADVTTTMNLRIAQGCFFLAALRSRAWVVARSTVPHIVCSFFLSLTVAGGPIGACKKEWLNDERIV